MRIWRAGHRDGGMTLGEVMIASSVLLVCLTSLAGVLGASVNSSRTARVRDEAANLANAKIEYARSLPYDSVGLHYSNGAYGDPAGAILTPEQVGSFTVVTDCTWVRTDAGRAAYKKFTVRVSWQQPNPGELAVTTMIYGKSDLGTTGDLLVKLRYRENSTPVENATVAILTSNNASRSVLTDTAGEAFFGQAYIGPVVVTVVPPAGCIVDTTTISSAAISGDSLATLIVYVQTPAQATIRVTDTSGALVPGASVSLRRADGAVLPSVTTDSSGEAHFAGLLYSDYTATIWKLGYPSATMPFIVNAGANQPVVPVTVTPLLGVGILVRVYDANTTPIAGATVSIRAAGDTAVLQSGTTGTNGEISFSGFAAGTYNATVEKTGLVSQVISTNLYDGDHDTLNFHMATAVYHGNMHIITKDKNGHLRSIRVIVSGSGYYSDTNWSNADGSLTLNDLVAGSYQVRCYTNPASTATVIVNGGQTAEVTIAQNK